MQSPGDLLIAVTSSFPFCLLLLPISLCAYPRRRWRTPSPLPLQSAGKHCQRELSVGDMWAWPINGTAPSLCSHSCSVCSSSPWCTPRDCGLHGRAAHCCYSQCLTRTSSMCQDRDPEAHETQGSSLRKLLHRRCSRRSPSSCTCTPPLCTFRLGSAQSVSARRLVRAQRTYDLPATGPGA